jgi:hypothetical protein
MKSTSVWRVTRQPIPLRTIDHVANSRWLVDLPKAIGIGKSNLIPSDRVVKVRTTWECLLKWTSWLRALQSDVGEPKSGILGSPMPDSPERIASFTPEARWH